MGKVGNRDASSSSVVTLAPASVLYLPQNNRGVLLEKEITSAVKGKDPIKMLMLGLLIYWKSYNEYLICLYIRSF